MKLTFEVFPSDRLRTEEIPPQWHLAITATSESLDPTLAAYQRLGPRHTPHISAALIKSEAHLEATRAVVRERVFLIGGDRSPLGPFTRSAELIPRFSHCRSIGIACYPQGHPSYPSPEFGDQLLLEKAHLGATYATSQMCFDSDALIEWIDRLREKGFDLPIFCGVAPPISVPKLTQFAIRCGVNSSLGFIRKSSTRDLAKMISRYDPRPFMEAVWERVDGFHIYTFNALKTTRRWVGQYPELAAILDDGK